MGLLGAMLRDRCRRAVVGPSSQIPAKAGETVVLIEVLQIDVRQKAWSSRPGRRPCLMRLERVVLDWILLRLRRSHLPPNDP